MKISSKSWKSYIDTLSKIDKKAAETVSNYYREHPDLSIEQLIGYCVAVADYYGNAAGELACEMYEEVAAASGKIVPPAEPAPTATYKEMAGAVRGTLLRSQNPDAVGAVVGRKVKTVGLDTILKNSLRDGAQFAWIPSGDTCAFCMMLASNGWQRASKKALKNGHASHVHNNCDCSYAVRFDDNTEVEGYDPDYYKEMYDNADGDNWNEKLNSMRRANYAANRDKINAQKRAAYAERNTFSSKRDVSTEWAGEPRINSEEDIEKLKQFALEKGFHLDPSFKSFDGDISLIEDFINKMDENLSEREFVRKRKIKLSVSYKMDDADYAQTNSSNIIINGNAYRDRKLLSEDYKNRLKRNWFTKGSSYLDIPTHECGHVIVYLNQIKVNDIIEKVFGLDRDWYESTVLNHISEYALENASELVAECYTAYRNGSNDKYILKVLKHCGIIN